MKPAMILAWFRQLAARKCSLGSLYLRLTRVSDAVNWASKHHPPSRCGARGSEHSAEGCEYDELGPVSR